MPTYEYRCSNCAYEFEEYQSITADPLSKCPKCKGKLVRIISGGSGILFKGSGFYETDYRSSKYKKEAAEDKKGSSSSDKKDSTTASATSPKAESSSKKTTSST